MKAILSMLPLLILASMAQAQMSPADRAKSIDIVSAVYGIADQTTNLDCGVELNADGTSVADSIREFSDLMHDEIMTYALDSDRYKNSDDPYPFTVTQDAKNPLVITLTSEQDGSNYPEIPREEYDTTLTYTFTLSKPLNDSTSRVVNFVRTNDFSTKQFAEDNTTIKSLVKTPQSSITCKPTADN